MWAKKLFLQEHFHHEAHYILAIESNLPKNYISTGKGLLIWSFLTRNVFIIIFYSGISLKNRLTAAKQCKSTHNHKKASRGAKKRLLR